MYCYKKGTMGMEVTAQIYNSKSLTCKDSVVASLSLPPPVSTAISVTAPSAIPLPISPGASSTVCPESLRLSGGKGVLLVLGHQRGGLSAALGGEDTIRRGAVPGDIRALLTNLFLNLPLGPSRIFHPCS